MPFVKPVIEKNTKLDLDHSYWDFLGFGVEKNNKLVYIVFGGWASKEAHDAGADHIPGLEKRLNFTGAAYVQVMKALQQSDELVTKIAAKIDALAIANLKEETDELDEDGNKIKVPFFTAEQRVEPDLSVLN
jgi:hypothetical protein